MPSATTSKGPFRVAGASGGFTDRQRSIHDIAKNCDVDFIMGDWMSECTMSIHGSQEAAALAKLAEDPNAEVSTAFFDPCFMDTLTPALPLLQEKGIKLAVNAGASAPGVLAKMVQGRVDEMKLSLKIAWIEGDNVFPQVNELRKSGDAFKNLDTGKELKDWGYEPIAAQCYLGAMGIAEALKAGADIVICGRVADPSPCVAGAIWWHNWTRDNLDEMAAALMAGHIIECSTYATGGYYSGFKNLLNNCEDLGFPIASIDSAGDVVLSMEANKGGEVSIGTIASQLVYEIQGPLYYNSDVTADIENVKLEQIGKNQVRMTGVKGLTPPETTKVGITARGGFQAEFHFLFCGLDIKEKCEWTEKQIRYGMRNEIEKFTVLKFQTVGTVPDDPTTQNEATVLFRVFVQTKDPTVMGNAGGSMASMAGARFQRWCMENFLQSCPGASVAPDLRTSSAKPIFEYWVALLPQSVVKQKAFLGWSGESIDIPPPPTSKAYQRQQKSYDTASPVDLASFGPTTRCALGRVVMGRSGDKASDANVGFFVKQDDEYEWLKSLLTTQKLIDLLGPEYLGHGVDRFEMPGIRAVHFLLHDHLDRGFNSSSSLDGLAKNLCEFLRSKWVDVPNKFLERGTI